MSILDDFNKAQNKLRAKKKENAILEDFYAEQKKIQSEKKEKPLYTGKTDALYEDDGDIAPITTTTKKDEERKWFQKGEFEDGYQLGDITKTILGTKTDISENLLAGVLGMGEKAVDAGAYIVGGVGGLFGNDDLKDKMSGFIKKDLYDEEKVAKKIIGLSDYGMLNDMIGVDSEYSSVLGEKSDALVQSAGQLAGTLGLQAVGVPWFVTSGVVSFGSEAENALNQGASYGRAGMSAAISAGAEILTEKLFGGSGLGETGLIAVDRLTKGITNKAVKALADYGVDILAEGSEEVISEFMSNLGSSLYKEKNLGEILFSEEAIDGYIESFIGGGVLGGVMNASNAVTSVKSGRDYRSGLSVNEQKVVQKEVENRIAEQEKGGKKLTNKEKAALEEAVVRDMERGYISTDTIEEVLGGESYNTYKRTVDYEDSLLNEFTELNRMKQSDMTGEQIDRRMELKQQLEDIKQNSKRDLYKSNLSDNVLRSIQNDRLTESYNERSRRGQAFEADLTKYDTKQQETIKKAVESGILNNTNRTHEFVDMIAKITADKGVLFDFTNNERLKESGFAVEDKQVNGFVTKDGVTLNMDSAKSLNSVVGHEITHVLEGTELYTALQSAVTEYAKTKGDYQGRYDSLSKLYEGVEGADMDSELTADLVGDYLFTDEDFVRNLSVQHRNVFQKIYDEIKYLCKVATAGSKEARELEKVKRAFEKAYQESGKQHGDTKYSLSMVEAVKPTSGKWQVGASTDEVRAAHPTLYAVDEYATDERNPTQVKGTIGSYRKVYNALQSEGFNGTILDASSGLGYGTKAGIEEYGFDVEDIEPYPDSDYKPKYTDYSSLNKKYDAIISNAVLNVLPQDQRDALVIKMGELLNDGGRMFVNVRGKDVLNASGKIAINEANMEYFIPRTAKTGSYQKGFTKPELVAYLQDALGDRFTVQPTNLFGAVSAIVTKNDGVKYSLSDANQLEADLNALKQERAELEEQLDTAFFNDLSDIEVRKLNNRLTKVNADIGKIVAEERKSTVKTSMQEILDNLSNYRRSDLESIAEQISDGAWDDYGELSRSELEDALREAIQNRELTPLEMQSKKFGLNVRPVEKVSYSISDSDGKQLSKEQQSDGDFKVMDGGAVTKYSLSTWTPETQEKVRANLVKAGYEGERVDKWIKDTNSVASMIAADKDRLDFEAADNQTMLKNNEEYVKTLDASTLCAKRLVYQGTFDAIQHRMPNTMLSSDDLIDLLNMMKEHNVQTPCGVCYVESRRRHLGKFAQEWLNGYNGEYKPNLDEVTTSDGLEALRKSHPQAYEDFITAMNKKGSSNPKVVQLRTEYRNEIMSLTPAQIRKIEAIGGLRVQSFSDFETPHMLDMMQAVMDMSAKGLHSQAYTKVPNFAWVFGDTGIKINLSLIAEGNGFDSDGNLAFSSVEGMDIDEAMKLRDAYSQNVGTIIVGANDKHILACMADDRIDFIIPFHRSGWGMKELDMMGMSSYTDYTYGQKEHDLATGKGVANLYPPDYWDYNLSGKENAERYLNLCAKTGREPKFSHFLVNNGDGSYSLQPDGSTDGYWKTLIDFKMYDNDGNGAAQQKVQPNFNMEEAYRVLNDYEGGANSLPVANDVVEEFVAKYQNKKSLSRADEEFAPIGKYNVYGKDMKLETAPVPNTDSNTQPVSNTDSNTVNALESVEEDIAPVAKPSMPVYERRGPYMAANAPVEKYEAIRPKRETQPRMARDTTEEQAIADILVDEPKVDKKKKNGLWNWAKVNLIDPGTVFETLSLKSGNPELQAKFSSIKRAESRAQRFMENGNGMTSSLKSIREAVEKTGKTKQFYEYLYHLHNADRMTLEDRYSDVENKPVFGSSITADISNLEVAELEKRNPEFKRLAQEVYNYMGNLREMLVEGGVISEETAQLWQEMYPHYVPIRREGYDGVNINVPLDTGRTGINAPVKRAKGGNSNILPLFDTMAQRTIQTFKAVAKNRFGVELKNTLGTAIGSEAMSLDEAIEGVDTHEELLQEGKNGRSPTFTVFENGEKVTFEITDEMYDAMKPKSGAANINIKALNAMNNWRRGLITEYNPVFAITNPIKDIQDVLINSKHPARTYANMPKAIGELLSNGHWYREYLDNGGEQNTYFEGETNTFVKEKSTLRKVVGFPLDKLSQVNNFIEKVPRLAEYIASRKAGRSIDVSMLDAARVTTDFSAGGHITKMMNRNGFTFLNASVQGAVQQVRNIREAKHNGLKGWAQLAAKTVAAGLPAILLNHLLWEDDEEYEELSDYVKQNYYIVGKFGDGKFVRIPKGRTLAVIQNGFEQMENLITGNDEADLEAFTDLVISNLAPNNPLDNNIIAPIAQALRNETWYGEDLVPTRLQDLPSAEQYDESTDVISRWLGERTPFSPYKLNYLLDQYSGGLGDTFLPMLTPEAESGDDTLKGYLLAPLRDKFTTDAVMNNQNVSDFYNKKDELTVNANATGATDEDVLKNKYMNSVNADLAKLYAEKRKIQNSDLPDSEKYAAVRDVQSQIVALTRESLGTYENISYEEDDIAVIGDKYFKQNDEGEWSKLSDEQVRKHEITREAGDAPYATDGDIHYRYYEPDEDSTAEAGWRKLTDEQVEKQEEVTKGLGISAEEYWGNKEEYDYAYEHPESYAVAKAVGGYEAYRTYSSEMYDIKADKDESGKSISGSRKEKIWDYVNGLDIEDGEKYILFKKEYNADDTYNYEIIDYLNSREDISYEDMATILKKLGFTVSANGDISW